MTPMEYAQHITQLAAAFKVELLVDRRMAPERAGAGFRHADRGKPHDQRRMLIMIAPINDDTSYAVALHELGHCLAPLGMVCQSQGSRTMRVTNRLSSIRDCRLKLMEEEAAWEWARHFAREWTVGMDMVERQSLDAYRNNLAKFGVKR